MGLELYYHASQEPFTNVLFANVVGREDLSGIDMAGWNVKKRMAMYESAQSWLEGALTNSNTMRPGIPARVSQRWQDHTLSSEFRVYSSLHTANRPKR